MTLHDTFIILRYLREVKELATRTILITWVISLKMKPIFPLKVKMKQYRFNLNSVSFLNPEQLFFETNQISWSNGGRKYKNKNVFFCVPLICLGKLTLIYYQSKPYSQLIGIKEQK